MKASGPERRRVVAVTRNENLIASLRGDSRLTLIAHFRDPVLASAMLRTLAADAIVVDEDLNTDLDVRGDGRGGPEICVLPGGNTPPPSSPVVARPGPADPDPGRAGVWEAGAPGGTLREWWEASGGRPQPAGTPGGRGEPGAVAAPEVLMRQFVTVISPKGGVGKTFLSVNLAAALARHSGFRVLLIDLDLYSGDAGVHLDLIGRPTLAELIPYAADLEVHHIQKAIARHEASGLEAILAPNRPEASETVGTEHLRALFRTVRPRYEFIVVDTPPHPEHPLVQECLAEASVILLVSSLDAASLRQCRLFLDLHGAVPAESGGGGDTDLCGRLTVVLNQTHSSGPLPAERAAAFLGTQAGTRVLRIPEDRAAVERSVFHGQPLVLTDVGHPVSRAVYAVADLICPVFGSLVADPPARASGLRGLWEALRRW